MTVVSRSGTPSAQVIRSLLAAREILQQFIREQFMDTKLHKQATTIPKIRAEIQTAPSSIADSELAHQYHTDYDARPFGV